MSVFTRYWTFNLVMWSLSLWLIVVSLSEPRYVVGALIVFVAQGLLGLRFRCPKCRNPLVKKRKYFYGPPLTRSCPKCCAQL
jgi:hypothetical protein